MDENLKDKSETELLRLVNKTNDEHAKIKKYMLSLLDEYDNSKEKLEKIENYYVKLMEEITTRKNVI